MIQLSSIIDFFSGLPSFQSLTRNDREVLLRSNCPLFLQYVLAKYFGSYDGSDQLSWILNGSMKILPPFNRSILKRIDPAEPPEIAELFQSRQMMDFFSASSMQIFYLMPFSVKLNGLVANLLLFFSSDTIKDKLEEKEKVQVMLEDAKNLLRFGSRHLDGTTDDSFIENLEPIVETLQIMKCVFDTWKFEKYDRHFARMPKMLDFDYTDGEEFWLQHQFDKVQGEFKSVSPPDDFVRESLSIALTGQNASNAFMRSWIGMTNERARRVLKIHPEFVDLVGTEQVCIFC